MTTTQFSLLKAPSRTTIIDREVFKKSPKEKAKLAKLKKEFKKQQTNNK